MPAGLPLLRSQRGLAPPYSSILSSTEKMSMSAIEDHRMSPARRMGILLAIVVALLGGIACIAPSGFWPMSWDETAAEQGRTMIPYTRLEFARAIERAIRGN